MLRCCAYGSYSRLILIWMTTEAVRTGNRELELGRSLSRFMALLGLQATGGHWGTRPESPPAPTDNQVVSSRSGGVLCFPSGPLLDRLKCLRQFDDADGIGLIIQREPLGARIN